MAPEYMGIDHLGVVVEDLEAATHTYQEVLGFALEGKESLPDRGLDVAFFNAGNARIELLAPLREDSEVSGFLRRRGPGVHHVCVRVSDLECTLARLKARGARLLNDTPAPGAHGTRVAFVHPKGAHGVLMELVELP